MTRHTDFARLERDWGIALLAQDYLPPQFRNDFAGAMDAQPALVTASNAGIPSWLTNYVDPEVIRIVQAPNEGANIFGEKKTGDWTTETALFTVVENTGEVSSYGDFNTSGRSDSNVSWPQRQSYHFQTIVEYGDREMERAGLAKLSRVGELQISAAATLDKFGDYTYHFGVGGLQNYGALNDPALSAPLTPTSKAAGGTVWVNATTGAVTATANEVYGDIQALFSQLVKQTAGRVKRTDAMTLALPPQSEVGLTATNNFGISVEDLIKKNFPSLKVKSSFRYATQAGNVVQLIADKFEGQDTAYCAFTEKLRDHAVVRDISSYRQKKTSGTWGCIIRFPMGVSQMVGV